MHSGTAVAGQSTAAVQQARSGDAAACAALSVPQKKAVVATVVRAQDGAAADALGIDRKEFSRAADYARIDFSVDDNNNPGNLSQSFTDIPDHELDDTQKADLEAINTALLADGRRAKLPVLPHAIGVSLSLDQDGGSGSKASARLADSLKSLFQKRIVFVRAASGEIPWYGANSPSRRNALFVNADQPGPLLYTTGHELGHAMEAQAPDVYGRLKQAILAEAGDWSAYRDNLLQLGYDPAAAETEFVNDFIGNQWNEPAFWKTLEEKKPGLFREFARAALDWLNRLLDKINGMARDVRPYFQDIAAARNALADALTEYTVAGQFPELILKT